MKERGGRERKRERKKGRERERERKERRIVKIFIVISWQRF